MIGGIPHCHFWRVVTESELGPARRAAGEAAKEAAFQRVLARWKAMTSRGPPNILAPVAFAIMRATSADTPDAAVALAHRGGPRQEVIIPIHPYLDACSSHT